MQYNDWVQIYSGLDGMHTRFQGPDRVTREKVESLVLANLANK